MPRYTFFYREMSNEHKIITLCRYLILKQLKIYASPHIPIVDKERGFKNNCRAYCIRGNNCFLSKALLEL